MRSPSGNVLLTLAILGLTMGQALADPFSKGDPSIGKNLVEKSCTACHASMFGGDGSTIYTRPDHKIKNAQQLLSRIRVCNTNSGAGWYPEEETHAAAYLNMKYYHFK